MATFARTLAGDLQIPRVLVTDPAECARQWIIDSLSLWLGEWFLDTTEGFPWAQKVLGLKNASATEIKGLLRQAIKAAPAVVTVSAAAFFNRQLRQFAYTFAATLNTGQIITGGSGQPTQITGSPA